MRKDVRIDRKNPAGKLVHPPRSLLLTSAPSRTRRPARSWESMRTSEADSANPNCGRIARCLAHRKESIADHRYSLHDAASLEFLRVFWGRQSVNQRLASLLWRTRPLRGGSGDGLEAWGAEKESFDLVFMDVRSRYDGSSDRERFEKGRSGGVRFRSWL